ncbi:hypothetical protein EfmAA96_28040 [Enterococcus faecium]|nr:hypothetical protein EfmAA96_28040 [Enterococcus faecium]
MVTLLLLRRLYLLYIKNIVAYVTVGMKLLYIDQTYYQVEPKVVDVEIIKIGINIKI